MRTKRVTRLRMRHGCGKFGETAAKPAFNCGNFAAGFKPQAERQQAAVENLDSLLRGKITEIKTREKVG